MAEIGSLLLSGGQGIAGGINQLGQQWRDQNERAAAEEKLAALSKMYPGLFGAQPVANPMQGHGQQTPVQQPQTLASLSQNPGNATTAQIPAVSPQNRPIAQGLANEFAGKWAQQPGQIGGAVPALAGLSAPASAATTPPRSTQAMAFAGGDLAPSGNAISGIESGGRYDALGPQTRTGDRAYGKYQVMGANIPSWTEKYLGQRMSPQDFLANPQAQEAVFKGEFGRLQQQYGPEGAARAWFAGEGGMNDPNRRDVLGTTVAQYGSKFANSYAQQTGQPANPLANIPPMQSQAQAPMTLGQLQGQATQQQSMPGLADLAGLMTNRYTAPIAQAIISKQLGRDPIEQQMQLIRLQQAQQGLANSPIQQQMLAEQLRAAQLGNQRTQAELTGEGAKFDREVQQRANAVKAMGLDPATPAGQQYILTGKLPDTFGEGSLANKEAQKEIGQAQGKIAASAPQAIASGQQVMAGIDEIMNHPSFNNNIIGGALGAPGMINQRIPGSQAYNLARRFDQLKGQTFLQAYDQLRGGGAITETEGKKAQDALARLDTAQSPQDIKQALMDFKSIIQSGMQRAGQMGQKFGTIPKEAPVQQPQQPQAGQIQDGATATNPKTGQRIRFSGGQWVPVQ